jgi:hypothetical protein
VTIELFNDYKALQMLQTIVTKTLKIHEKIVISTKNLRNVKKNFAKKIKNCHAILIEKVREEIMKFYDQIIRILSFEKSFFLIIYFRKNQKSVIVSMKAQYDLNSKMLFYMMKIIINLTTKLNNLRNVAKKVSNKKRKERTINFDDDDVQNIKISRKNKRIAKRQTNVRTI